MKNRHLIFISILLIFSNLFASCASTGPKVSKAERKQKEEEFNAKFLEASNKWVPRVYRVGYRLVTSHVPGHGKNQPRFSFAGIGVDDFKDYARKIYGADKSVKGVMVLGLYPGSKAEGIDLKPGDIIVKVNGKKTKNLGSYFKRIRRSDGKTVKITAWRSGQWIEREAPLEKVFYNAQFFLSPTPDVDAHAAFSKINVGIGAIRYCRNDDELAVIMGHELAHTTLKHSLKTMGVGLSTSVAYGALAGLIDAFTYGGVGNVVTRPMQEATQAAISRRYEREADYFGMKHAFHAGYDVENGSKVFSRLATDAPGFTLLAYTFATHPETSERFLRLQKMIDEFKTQYPEKFPLEKNQDWELTVPVSAGETLDIALERLIQEKKRIESTAPVVKAANSSKSAVPESVRATG